MVFKMSFFTEKDWSSETLWNFDDITPFIQAHLFKVYLALCCTLMASAFGVHCHVCCNTGGIITTFGFIGSMGWLFLTSPWKEEALDIVRLCKEDQDTTFFQGDIGSYLQKKGRVSPSKALRYALDIARGMNYLHECKPDAIIHCDLKPKCQKYFAGHWRSVEGSWIWFDKIV